VFSNPAALQKLEAITHPIIGAAINTLITRAQQSVVVIEAIKLLEGDLAKMIDAVWVVDAKPETQLKRLMEKRKMSDADGRQRIAAQAPQAEKLKRATVVINNDGNVEETWKQVQTAWNAIPKAGAPAQPAAPAAQPQPKPAAPAAPQPPAAPRPAAPPPAAQAPAPPKPVAPSQRPPSAPPVSLQQTTGDIVVRRGMPQNAEAIASFIRTAAGKDITRMDIMMAFGEKSYLVAQDTTEKLVALMGWQVENLITRVDEFYVDSAAPRGPVTQALIIAIEEASKELQSEVGFIFLPVDAAADAVQPFLDNGYEKTTVSEIKIPAWREAVQDVAKTDVQIFRKQLRKDRVLKPI
jgi:dephospho-CoA kinase